MDMRPRSLFAEVQDTREQLGVGSQASPEGQRSDRLTRETLFDDADTRQASPRRGQPAPVRAWAQRGMIGARRGLKGVAGS